MRLCRSCHARGSPRTAHAQAAHRAVRPRARQTLVDEMGDMGLQDESEVVDFPTELKDALGDKKMLRHRDSDVK